MTIRARLTLTYAGLLVTCTAAVLGVSWWLLGRHLERTVPAAADAALGELATQYVLAVAGTGLLALGVGWAAAGHALAPLRAVVEAQRRFIANASHELRTPLTVIRTEAEVALDDGHATPADLREALRGAVEGAVRAEALLEGLLGLARATQAMRRDEPVDLAATARGVLGDVHADARLEPAVVRGDRALLERLAANLVENAVRHGRGRPQLTVRSDGADALLRVVNDGEPVPPAVVARLAEPFERGTRAHGAGYGLGLSIVRAIADAHGGALALRARDGGGLEAEVRLPLASR